MIRWFPNIPSRQLPALIRITLLSALFAGAYGAVHDQISYKISPEYFTRMKFHQFAWADFGGSPRVFAATIGFLSTWWVGLIGGWVLGRLGLAVASWRHTAKALAIAGGVAALTGEIGVLIGIFVAENDLESWNAWRVELKIKDLYAFVIVAYLHWASYAGGLLGLICAGIYVMRNRGLSTSLSAEFETHRLSGR